MMVVAGRERVWRWSSRAFGFCSVQNLSGGPGRVMMFVALSISDDSSGCQTLS
jgi:hypothetical protein